MDENSSLYAFLTEVMKNMSQSPSAADRTFEENFHRNRDLDHLKNIERYLFMQTLLMAAPYGIDMVEQVNLPISSPPRQASKLYGRIVQKGCTKTYHPECREILELLFPQSGSRQTCPTQTQPHEDADRQSDNAPHKKSPPVQESPSTSEPPSEFRVEQIAHKILCHQLLMFHNSHTYEQETREVISLMERLGFMSWPFDPDISQLGILLSHCDSENRTEKNKA